MSVIAHLLLSPFCSSFHGPETEIGDGERGMHFFWIRWRQLDMNECGECTSVIGKGGCCDSCRSRGNRWMGSFVARSPSMVGYVGDLCDVRREGAEA